MVSESRKLFGLTFLLVFLTGCSSVRQISQSGFGAYEVSLSRSPDGFAAAWYDTRDGQAEIYLRFLNSEGRSLGPEHRLTHNAESSYEADVEAVGGDFAVVWYDRSDTATYAAKLGLWARDGTEKWVRTLSSEGRNGRIPVVKATGTEIFCAWVEDDRGEGFEVWAGWWDLEGQPILPPRRIGAAGRRTWNLNATLDEDGQVWVVFDGAVDTRSDELFLVEVDREESRLVRLTADDGFDSKYPDLEFGGGRAALTWFDGREGNEEIYIIVTSIDNIREGLENQAVRVTTTPGASIGAYVAWNAPRFGLTWSDDSEGQHEVYFQPFDREGRALGALRRLTHTETDSLIPAIRPWADGFALLWNEFEPGPRGGHDEQGGRSEIVFSFVR